MARRHHGLRPVPVSPEGLTRTKKSRVGNRRGSRADKLGLSLLLHLGNGVLKISEHLLADVFVGDRHAGGIEIGA